MWNSGCPTRVRHSSCSSSATHSNRCMQYFPVLRQWYGCQCLGFLMSTCNCTQGLYVHCNRVCAGSWLWKKNPLSHRGLEPGSVLCLVFQSDIWPTELSPSFCVLLKATCQWWVKKTVYKFNENILLKCCCTFHINNMKARLSVSPLKTKTNFCQIDSVLRCSRSKYNASTINYLLVFFPTLWPKIYKQNKQYFLLFLHFPLSFFICKMNGQCTYSNKTIAHFNGGRYMLKGFISNISKTSTLSLTHTHAHTHTHACLHTHTQHSLTHAHSTDTFFLWACVHMTNLVRKFLHMYTNIKENIQSIFDRCITHKIWREKQFLPCIPPLNFECHTPFSFVKLLGNASKII